MWITRETDYAIRCVLHLAVSGDEVVAMEEISEARAIPKSFLAKILQKLAKEGIVKSYRGVKGGFGLAKPPEQITLLDIVLAIQGSVALNLCAVDNKLCMQSGKCVVHPLWVSLKRDMAELLKRYDFKHLAELDKKSAGACALPYHNEH